MKIAITGAGGFLGTELLRQLSARDDITVYAFTFNFERVRDTFIKAQNIIPVDNSEVESFCYTGIDVVINCAFPRNVSDATFASGLDFIQKVIDKASSDKVGSFINISSQSVYSQIRENSADENEPCVLETKYAVGKYCSELAVNYAFKDIPHTNLRMASLIGAGFNQRLVNKFAQMIVDGTRLSIAGGKQLFGFLDVRDAASGIITAALSDKNWDECYNLGTNNAYTLSELAEMTVKIGKEHGIEALPPEYSESDKWQNSALDCRKFCEKFSWEPQYPIETTIKDIFRNIIDPAL